MSNGLAYISEGAEQNEGGTKNNGPSAPAAVRYRKRNRNNFFVLDTAITLLYIDDGPGSLFFRVWLGHDHWEGGET